MADPLEKVAVSINGQAFSGWSEISIDYAVDHAARTASLVVSDYAGAMPFHWGDEATISAGGDTILTGYVRDVSPSHDGERHQVHISLVSKAIDAVEASIDHPTGFVKQKDLVAVAREFDTAGVGIVASESFPVEPARFVNTGESLFYHLEPLARSHSAFLYDTPEGKLRIAKKPRGRHAGGLAIGPGGNIISASANFSEDGRFSPVIVRGQSSKGTGAAALRIEARATDAMVKRKRPRVIIHESEATAEKLKERARRNVRQAAGKSTTAEIEVAGWRDAGGQIFTEHFTIAVNDPRIYLDRDMAIRAVTLTQDIRGGGTRARLSLVDPAALNGEASGGGGGSDLWRTPSTSPTIGFAK